MKWHMPMIVVASLVMTAGSLKADEAKKDAEKVQGTWIVASAELSGKSVESSKGDEFTFSGGKVTIKTKTKTSKPQPYTLDEGKSPKEIDITEGQGKSLGIYELNGDSLRLCYWPGKRPSEFKSNSALLLVLKRRTSKAAALCIGGPDESRQEVKELEGTWAAVSYVQDGQGEGETISPNESPIRWLIKGNKVMFLADVAEASAKGAIKLAPAMKPKTIDMAFPPAPGSDHSQTMLGIYEVEGDTLRICYGLDGVKRPTEFKSKPQSSHILVVFKRMKEAGLNDRR